MRIFALVAAASTAVACSPMQMPDHPAVASSYDQLAVTATSALDTYCAATTSMTSGPGCQSAVQGYGPAMKAELDRMVSMGAEMDQQMRMMGQAMCADMQCGMGVMEQELQQHLGVACTLADMDANRAEAARHCAAMSTDLDHMRMRAAEMTSMMDSGGGMMGGGSGMMDGGWTMPGGGTMPWSHTIPGCTGSAPAGGSSPVQP